jgi:murein tripeptide amidase MpaA
MFSSRTKAWTQEGMFNVTFQEKRLKYDFLYERAKVESFYELSFEFDIEKQEEMKFAYCIPYSYSELLQDLEQIKEKAEIGVLGQTLTGINIPIVMFGRHDPEVKKQVTIITGRIHPGETNSSLIISNIMKTLSHG